LLKVVGIGFVALGLSAVFGLISAATYYVVRSNDWAKNNIFPIGLPEHALMYVVLAILGLMSIFLILFGIAIFRRKWPIKAWVTGVLAGLVFIGLAVGGSLTADVYPTVHSAYNANSHSTERIINQSFSNIYIEGDGIENINYVQSNKSMVVFSYYGHPNLNAIKTNVIGGNLIIDSSNFNPNRNCSTLCIPSMYRVDINVYSPNATQIGNDTFNGPPPQLAPAIVKP
jgi:hypothetical protein